MKLLTGISYSSKNTNYGTNAQDQSLYTGVGTNDGSRLYHQLRAV